MQALAETVTQFLDQYIPAELAVFFISMLPVFELRGGIIAAALLKMPWYRTIPISVLGNILPVPFILLFIRKILELLGQWKPTAKLAGHFEEKALSKGAELVRKYPKRIQIGLYAFVAIPLPMTGAWTGSLIAAFMGLPLKKSLPPIFLGVLTAMVIMMVISYLFPSLIFG